MATETLDVQEFHNGLSHAPAAPAPMVPSHSVTDADLAAFDQASREWQAVLDDAGITDIDAVQDFEDWRRNGRK